MCTIVLIRNTIDGYPIAVAANRDEYLDRPSEPMEERDGGIFAPKDSKRGGTWIGINDRGVFAGLTNRNGVIGKPGKISRGDLPNLALQYGTAKEAFTAIRETYPTGKDFNGFYLVIADKHSAYLFGGDGLHLTYREVTENVLAVTNRGVGTVGDVGLPETPRRVSHLIAGWQAAQSSLSGQYQAAPERREDEIITILKNLLHIHDEDRHGTCVNEPENNYGTKSSSIILLNEAENELLYCHRERQGNKHICNYDFTYHSVKLDC